MKKKTKTKTEQTRRNRLTRCCLRAETLQNCEPVIKVNKGELKTMKTQTLRSIVLVLVLVLAVHCAWSNYARKGSNSILLGNLNVQSFKNLKPEESQGHPMTAFCKISVSFRKAKNFKMTTPFMYNFRSLISRKRKPKIFRFENVMERGFREILTFVKL